MKNDDFELFDIKPQHKITELEIEDITDREPTQTTEQKDYMATVRRTCYDDYCNEYIDFSGAVSDIPSSSYDKVYVARAYVTLTV